MNQDPAAGEEVVSEEAILFGHLTLSGVPQDVIQVLFHYGVSKLEQLTLLNTEILQNMEIEDPQLQGLIVEAAQQAARGNIQILSGAMPAVDEEGTGEYADETFNDDGV